MGIYGESLLAFPEQFRTITVYKMDPIMNGGWTKQEGSDTQVLGIFQNSRGHAIKDSNGNLVSTGGQELWTQTKDLAGSFTQIEGDVYRISGDNNWDFEGGFYKYSLDKVVGNNGTESDNASWNLGSHSFC